MSMSHKAFEFDWDVFVEDGVCDLISQTLTSQLTQPLMTYVERHYANLKSPYDGKPLDREWMSQMEAGGTAQELADFALTACYDPRLDIRVGACWLELDNQLAPGTRHCLLGWPLEVSGVAFDPGYQGSYFQSPDQVKETRRILRSTPRGHGEGDSALRHFVERLVMIETSGKGLYVTF